MPLVYKEVVERDPGVSCIGGDVWWRSFIFLTRLLVEKKKDIFTQRLQEPRCVSLTTTKYQW